MLQCFSFPDLQTNSLSASVFPSPESHQQVETLCRLLKLFVTDAQCSWGQRSRTKRPFFDRSSGMQAQAADTPISDDSELPSYMFASIDTASDLQSSGFASEHVGAW